MKLRFKKASTPAMVASLSLMTCMAAAVNLEAAVQFRVVGLFNGKAMLQIDGTNHLLREGQEGPHGLVLISSDAKKAVIEVDGRQDEYRLGSHAGGTFAEPQDREVKIWQDSSGGYLTTGSINGRNTDMLVDTGATLVALSEIEAKRLGIDFLRNDRKTNVQTASGIANAYRVNLARVRVGDIELNNVNGVVLEGDSPRRVLLGMSFLNRVELNHQGNMLLLKSKY